MNERSGYGLVMPKYQIDTGFVSEGYSRRWVVVETDEGEDRARELAIAKYAKLIDTRDVVILDDTPGVEVEE